MFPFHSPTHTVASKLHPFILHFSPSIHTHTLCNNPSPDPQRTRAPSVPPTPLLLSYLGSSSSRLKLERDSRRRFSFSCSLASLRDLPQASKRSAFCPLSASYIYRNPISKFTIQADLSVPNQIYLSHACSNFLALIVSPSRPCLHLISCGCIHVSNYICEFTFQKCLPPHTDPPTHTHTHVL